LKHGIHGIIPALCLPYHDDGSFNAREFARLVASQIDAGVHGLMVSGGTGEFMSTTREEKREILRVALETAAGRLPVIAGTGAVTTAETIALTQDAEALGANAVSVITPYSLRPSQEELYEHYRAVCTATRLPVFIYNNPGMGSGNIVEPPTVRRLAAIENLAGIKDSTGDMTRLARLACDASGDFTVLVGNDAMILAGLVYGAKGAITACANLVPEAMVGLYNAFQRGDLATALRLQQQTILPLRECWGWCTQPQLLREGLELRGFRMGPPRAPLSHLAPERRAEFATVVERIREVILA
jgi:4-hydroxy-tetrahydrodipicolinate synthase